MRSFSNSLNEFEVGRGMERLGEDFDNCRCRGKIIEWQKKSVFKKKLWNGVCGCA